MIELKLIFFKKMKLIHMKKNFKKLEILIHCDVLYLSVKIQNSKFSIITTKQSQPKD